MVSFQYVSWRNTRLLALLLALFGLSLFEAPSWGQEKSFLWRAEGDHNTVYILGSIHFLKRDSAALKPVVQEVFDKSKRLVLEIDLVKEGPENFQKLLMQKGLNPDGKTLADQLTAETYAMAAQRATELGIDIKLMAPFKPWFAALTMVVMQLQKLGYDSSSGLDHQLAQRAKQADKPVTGLETVEFQLEIFNRLSAAQQDMFLRQSMVEMDQIEKSVNDMVAAWSSGDVALGERLFLESLRAYPELKTKVLDERNHNWLTQIEQFLKQDDDMLVTVGTAHLVGKDGIIELLKARGYKLEQM